MTDESTERKAPCVEVVTLNNILLGILFSYGSEPYDRRRRKDFVTDSKLVEKENDHESHESTIDTNCSKN